MKKVSRLFAGFAAIALFTACSSDEPIDGGKQNGNTGKPVGDTAYMTINISDVNEFGGAFGAPKSREGYEDGKDYGAVKEHAVKNAKFYFYDENGTFVLEGKIANPNFVEDNPADENIEFMSGENILVLEGLTGKNWPSYLITILNADDFTPEATMAATAKKLDTYKRVLGGVDYMVMSTSSYFSADGKGTKNHDNNYPYATKLEESDFYTSPTEAVEAGKAVKVYIERLAAKVQLDVEATTETAVYRDEEGKMHTIYKLTQTVAGNPNDQENADDKATTDLYVEVLGWNLSATATKSYISKKIDKWSATAPYTGAEWNKPEYFRSFWAESAVYGQNPVTDVTGSTDPNALGLVYTTFGANSKALGEAAYCNENTNEADAVFATNIDNKQTVVASQATHVVLKARVCDKGGKALDLVSYHGVLYLKNHYIKYVLDKIQMGNPENLNFYTKDGDTYNQVGADFFTLAADGSGKTGQVNVVVADETATLYAKTGDKEYTASDNLMASLKAKLTANQPAATDTHCATAFTGGYNVYYIPVEHEIKAGAGKEGYYGVVRNHWYKLTVTSFSKVGHGVFDPINETLKPEGPEDPLYYLGVNLNILSWKIVNQNVPL